MPRLDPDFKYKFKKGDPLIVKVKVILEPNDVKFDEKLSKIADKYVLSYFNDYSGFATALIGSDELLKKIEDKEVYEILTSWTKKDILSDLHYNLGGDASNKITPQKVSKIKEGPIKGVDLVCRITSVHEPETFTFSAKDSIIEKLDRVITCLEKCGTFSVPVASQGVTEIGFSVDIDSIREMAREDAKFYCDKANNPNNLSVEELAAKCYKERVKYPSDDAQDAFYGEFMRTCHKQSHYENFSKKPKIEYKYVQANRLKVGDTILAYGVPKVIKEIGHKSSYIGVPRTSLIFEDGTSRSIQSDSIIRVPKDSRFK